MIIRAEPKMKNIFKKMIMILSGVLLFWIALTIWVEYSGGEKTSFVGNRSSSKKALIVYNPDPIYNLDEQVCEKFAEGLAGQDFYIKVATVKSANKDLKEYDLYVFCANTYNWSPDWLINDHIRNHSKLDNKKVVTITLGSGSTKRAKRLLEQVILSKNADLLYSGAFWLLKPNDEERMAEKNTKVATDMAGDLGSEIGLKLSAFN